MTATRRGVDGFAEDAQAWRAAVGARVPPYDRLLAAAAELLLAPADPVERAAGERLQAAWRERRFSAAYDRPLLLAAALRAEATRTGAAHPLHTAIAAEPPRPEAATRAAVAAALADAPARLYVDLATRWVQTNETSRAVAWLWPAYLAGCDVGGPPLALADIGCSAGLNLVGERLPPLWSDAGGAPLPVASGAHVVARLGLDARPLDVRRDDDVAWLRACVWPGETARLERLDQATAALRSALATGGAGAGAAPVIESADVASAAARLEALAARLPAGAVFIAYQTLVRDYLPRELRERYAAAMTAWVAAGGDPGVRRVFVELEVGPDGWSDPSTGAPLPMALTAHVRGAGGAPRALVLARCGYHPTVLAVDREAVAAFTAAVAQKI